MNNRETVAKIINPTAWPDESDDTYCWCVHCRYEREMEREIALKTADEILAAIIQNDRQK
jgi:hypothetical protein